jgi:hypothetical protein
MRTSLWSTIAGAAALAATIGPPESLASELHADIGIPKISFATSGAPLTRSVGVTLDDTYFSIDASAPICASSVQPPSYAFERAPSSCASSADQSTRWLGEHSAGVTLKLPQWHRDAPYVDLSVRTWRGDSLRDASRSATQRVAAEAEVTQAFGRYEINAGYSQPFAAADSWRVAWAGASMRIAPRTRVRLSFESAHDALTGARDSRYAIRLTRSASDSLRMTAYLMHAPEDVERRWRAGLGVDWTF